MFAGYQPPEQEAAPAAAAVDLARIEVLRGAAAKSGRAKAKDRGERPDGPTAVSRISDEDAATVTAKAAKDKSAKDKPETTKSAKDKAALDKACLDLANAAKAGKSAKGKPVKGKSITRAGTKAGTDPVCPADSDRDKKGKAAKAQPSHASRIWVQVLTGANRDVMDREWQRLVREASALRGRKPSITPWRSNFRLLTGPFDSEAEAQAFLDRLRKDGVSGFQWTSPAGQVVDSLQLK
ncbi:MAG: SPOR domain-containing protein [Novosphingobium sp.]